MQKCLESMPINIISARTNLLTLVLLRRFINECASMLVSFPSNFLCPFPCMKKLVNRCNNASSGSSLQLFIQMELKSINLIIVTS